MIYHNMYLTEGRTKQKRVCDFSRGVDRSLKDWIRTCNFTPGLGLKQPATPSGKVNEVWQSQMQSNANSPPKNQCTVSEIPPKKFVMWRSFTPTVATL